MQDVTNQLIESRSAGGHFSQRVLLKETLDMAASGKSQGSNRGPQFWLPGAAGYGFSKALLCRSEVTGE